MNRGAPLKRTGFRPRAPRREQRDPDRVRAYRQRIARRQRKEDTC